MPDLRTILRSFTPAHAVRNARRDVVEHARIVAEIDAIVQRLPEPGTPTVDDRPVAEVGGNGLDAFLEGTTTVSADAVVEERRAS